MELLKRDYKGGAIKATISLKGCEAEICDANGTVLAKGEPTALNAAEIQQMKATGRVETHKLGSYVLTETEAKTISDAIYDAKASIKAKMATNLPGLEELRVVCDKNESAYAWNTKRFDDEMTSSLAPRRLIDTAELRAKYPRAAAYLKAEGYSLAANDRKATAGHEAMALLVNGGAIEDAEQILKNWLDGVYVD